MSESRYFEFLKRLPRITLDNITHNPGAKKRKASRRGQHAKRSRAPPKSRPCYNMNDPFRLRMPRYGYYRDEHLKRQYFPLTLWTVQRMIDLGRIDPMQPIDITTLANSRTINFEGCDLNYCGVFLLEQGANIFDAQVNIEVQIASELAIAAVEKRGGVLTTSFLDQKSFQALTNPVRYFLRGEPIHKRPLPVQALVPYYTDPKVRGYLSNPAEIEQEKHKLAHKYGYELPDITDDENSEMLMMKKDPRQVFYGLSPGWIVNLADRNIIKPQNESHEKWAVL